MRAERASDGTAPSEKAEKYIDTVSEWGHNIEKAARRSGFVRAGGIMDRTEKCGKKFAELFGGKPVKDEGTDPEFMRILQRFIFGEVSYTGSLDDRMRELGCGSLSPSPCSSSTRLCRN